jgi:hypothetical protein
MKLEVGKTVYYKTGDFEARMHIFREIQHILVYYALVADIEIKFAPGRSPIGNCHESLSRQVENET